MPATSPLLVVLAVLLGIGWCANRTAASSPSQPGSPLALSCEVGGHLRTLVGVDAGGLQVDDEGRRSSAPPTARWTLTGDILAHADQLRWSPDYAIARDARQADGQCRATVRVVRKIDRAPKAALIQDTSLAQFARTITRTTDPFTTDWPGDPDRPAAVVAVWILDGHPTQVQLQPVPHPGSDRDFALEFEFILSARETAGQPALLLWRDGGFAIPAPFSTHAPTQAAFRAVFLRDVQALQAALRDRAHLDAVTPVERATLAHAAAGCGAVGCLDLILRARPRLAHAQCVEDESPALWAIRRGRTEAMARLVDETTPASVIKPALEYAVTLGHADAVKILMPRLSTSEADGARLPESIARMAWESGHPDIIRILGGSSLQGFADAYRVIETPGSSASPTAITPRHLLLSHARRGHLPMIEFMVPALIDVPEVAVGDQTALGAAAGNGHLAIVQHLVRSGANVNHSGTNGTTALMAAARGGHVDVVEFLLKAGARPNTTNADGLTALHFAAGQDSPALVRLLLDAGADLQICTIREITALDLALLTGTTESVQPLLDRGACIGLGASYSLELLQAAITHDIPAPVATALEQGWPPGSTFAGVWPALRVAEVIGSEACAGVLRAAGAAAQPNRPVPVTATGDLDQPMTLVTPPVFHDPRNPDEVFPATTIRVQVLVDAQGRALFPKVLDRVPPPLRVAAAKAAQLSRYAPPRQGGRPVATLTTQEIPVAASRDRVFTASEIQQYPRPVDTPRAYRPRVRPNQDRVARVVVDYVINPLGRPERIVISESSGPAYEDAIRLAMSCWTFVPGKFGDTPVAVRETHTFTFDHKPN